MFATTSLSYDSNKRLTDTLDDDQRKKAKIDQIMNYLNDGPPNCLESSIDSSDSYPAPPRNTDGTSNESVQFKGSIGLHEESSQTNLTDDDLHIVELIESLAPAFPSMQEELNNGENVYQQMDTTTEGQMSTEDSNPNGNQSLNLLEFSRESLNQASALVNDCRDILSQSFFDHSQNNVVHIEHHQNHATQRSKLDDLSRILERFKTEIDRFRAASLSSTAKANTSNENYDHHTSDAHPGETSEQRVTHLNEQSNEDIDQALSPQPLEPYLADAAPLIPLPLSESLEYSCESIQDESSRILLTLEYQPKPFHKARTLRDLSEAQCTEVQAGNGQQRKHPTITWTVQNGIQILENLFAQLQLLDVKGRPNQWKYLLGPKSTIPQLSPNEYIIGTIQTPTGRLSIEHVIMDPECEYDGEHRTILQPVTDQECRNQSKKLRFKIANVYKECVPTQRIALNSLESSTMIGNMTDDEMKKYWKFKVCLCERREDGRLVQVSNYVTSIIVEDYPGTNELQIELSSPTSICECGEETIDFTLNRKSEKNGFQIWIDQELLTPTDFVLPEGKTISFQSRPQEKSDKDHLHVMIIKRNQLQRIEENGHLIQNFIDKEWTFHIPYHPHDPNHHPHHRKK